MKKTKRLMLCGISALIGLAAISCNSNNGNTTDDTNKPNVIDMSTSESVTKSLSSISVDTTKGKTQYELGETFDSTGIVVSANYVEYIDNSPVGTKVELTSGYYFDYSLVDFKATGVYPVYCYFREGTKILSTTYKITVKSTAIVESGLSYVAGVQIVTQQYQNGDVDNSNVVVVTKDTPYQVPSFKAYVHNFIKDEEQSRVEIPASEIVLDDSSVDTSKEGIYYIKATYTAEPVNGIENKVVSFIIVNVINPITGIKFTSGEKNLSASANKLDTSSWKMTFVKERGEEVVNYDDYSFVMSDVNTLVAGDYTATITYADPTSVRLVYKEVSLTSSSFVANKYFTVDGSGNYNTAATYVEGTVYYKQCYSNNKKASFSTTVNITVVESTTEAIYSYMTFGEFLPSDYLETDAAESITAADIATNYGTTRIQILTNRDGSALAYANVNNTSGVDQHAPAEKDTKGTAFDIKATCRFKLNGAAGGNKANRNIEVIMPNKGTVVIYFATSSTGTERFLQMYDSNFNAVDEQIFGTASYGKAVFTVEQAGTYYFSSTSGGINIYAVIVSYEN